MKPKILVVDDEPDALEVLGFKLKEAGYAPLFAKDGARAISVARDERPALIVLDLMLPEVDGFEVVRQIRQSSTIPVVMLTARGEESSRVAGLELGADDYVVKPFLPHEVVARVRAHLRRARGFTSHEGGTLRTGTVELDQRGRTCTVDGTPVDLTRREFDLLEALMANPGRAFTREQLLDQVWGSQFVSEKTVDVHIVGLRQKLAGAIRISTLRGVGYRLEPCA